MYRDMQVIKIRPKSPALVRNKLYPILHFDDKFGICNFQQWTFTLYVKLRKGSYLDILRNVCFNLVQRNG